MMRKAQTPHEGCGLSRGGSWRRVAAGFACALSCALLIVTMTVLTADAALAQTAGATGDPFAPSSKQKQSSFPKGSVFGKVDTKIDRSQPMQLQGDQLIYDKAGNRVIARGNVEIYYNNYILTADEVVYDQGAGTLTAVGNVTLKEPQGNIVHADRYTLTDDFRDGFVQSLSIVTQDQSRITADRAIRRERQCHRIRERQVHALQERWRHAAAVVHQCDAHHSRSGRRDHHLSGRVFRDLRAADFLPALLSDSGSVCEAEVGLPVAHLRQLVDARLHHRHTLLLRARAELRLHRHSRIYEPTRFALCRASGATV